MQTRANLNVGVLQLDSFKTTILALALAWPELLLVLLVYNPDIGVLFVNYRVSTNMPNFTNPTKLQ